MVRITDHLLRQAQQHQKAGDWLAAAAAYAEMAVRYPRDHRVLANQGNALWLADLPAAAHQAYARALAIAPTCSITRRGLASCLRDLNQFEAALALHEELERSLETGSEHGLANLWAHSQVLIGLERFGEAFARMASRSPSSRLELQRPWNPLAPELTLTSEQGFGDTLQFVRFLIPLLRRRERFGLRGGVLLLVEPSLVELLGEGLAWLVDAPAVSPKPPAQAGQQALSLLDLPGILGVQHLPELGPDAAYLRASNWRFRPLRSPARIEVGLVWMAGRPGDDPFCMREFHKRSLPAQILWHLASELQRQGARVHNLQYGNDARWHRALGLELVQPAEGLSGFAATARAVAQLDLVITVDTAMAHLVGAMGRPCWVLLPWSSDPRWMRTDPVTPWYPHTRLFRQPRSGDWHGAVDALLEFFSSLRSGTVPHP